MVAFSAVKTELKESKMEKKEIKIDKNKVEKVLNCGWYLAFAAWTILITKKVIELDKEVND